MKTNDAFPSKYLKSADEIFLNGDVVATIKNVEMEKLTSREKGEENKPIMFFRELPKGMVVNKTNWKTCEKLFNSDESDDWIGQKVILATAQVTAYGEVMQSIIIRDEKPKVDKAQLIDSYQKLWERGKKAGVEGIENYVISPDMETNEIKELGADLKKKVLAAESF